MVYFNGIFETGNNTIPAYNIKPGMVISLRNKTFFCVHEIEKYFNNNESFIFFLENDEIITPEHLIYTFIDVKGNKIEKIPAKQRIAAFKQIIRKNEME